MKKEIIILDGENNGFVIYNLVTQSFITNKNGIVLFRNIELAKLYAANVKKLTNPYDYDINISLYGNIIQYDYFEKVDDYYQLFAEDGSEEEVKYFIKPIYNRGINTIGYLVVNNGEREFDKEKGSAKSNLYYRSALESFDKIIKTPSIEPNIESITKDRFGICVSLKRSTAKIHVCYNSQIMTINQERKQNGERAFSFDKDMDKYTTLYTFIDIDINEPKWFDGIGKAKQVIEMVASMMKNSVDSIQNCEFKEINLFKPLFIEKTYNRKDFMKRG